MKFRRQHPIGPYVVDFVDLEHMLVIEVDGIQHDDDARQVHHDIERDAWLRSLGYRIERFGNNEVRYHLHEVVDTIWGVIEEQRMSGRLRPWGAKRRDGSTP